MGNKVEGLACTYPGARTPIGASRNFIYILTYKVENEKKLLQSHDPKQIKELALVPIYPTTHPATRHPQRRERISAVFAKP
jgi:hypothetical protein